jgi:streptogramin lyase
MRGVQRYPIQLSYVLIAATWGVSCSALLPAQDQKIFQMLHTSFTARDGAPQNINTLAQTTDGMLWLGTRDGLYSFDGLKFSPFQPDSGPLHNRGVRSLFAAKDGSLWVAAGGLPPIRVRDGTTATFDRGDRGEVLSFHHIQQSSDGTMWAIQDPGDLLRLGGDGIWHVVSKPRSDFLACLFIDSLDRQWLVADNVLYLRRKAKRDFSQRRYAQTA